MFAYHGWMNIAPVAGEVRNPNRNLPLALLGGVGAVIFVYLGANLAYALIMPAADMAMEGKTTPVATVFTERLLGPIGAAVTSAAIMCSTFGALNGNLLVGPRILYAMGEDRLMPRSLSSIHPRYHTPALAILMTALWASVLVVAAAGLATYRLPIVNLGSFELDMNIREGKPIFDILTDFAMFGATTFETLGIMTIFIFRKTRPDADRPYRCPGYPWVPAIYVLILALVVGNIFITQLTEALVGVAFIAAGAGVYYLFGGSPPAVPTLPELMDEVLQGDSTSAELREAIQREKPLKPGAD
jgi:amino acid transporter